MAKHFDNISRYLMSFDTTAWARFLGINTSKAELSNADFSTVTSQADAFLLIGDDKKKAAHVEIQATYDADIGMRIVVYYVLGLRALDAALTSFLVLLRPEADGPAITGVVKHVADDGSLILEFHYHVIRVWEIPAEELFKGGLGIMPLAFIGKIDPGKLPDLVRRAEERLRGESDPGTISEFWTSIDLLMGLRYKRPFISNLLKGVRAMKESVTYQAIIEEGAAIGEARGEILGKRSTLMKLASKKFGQPDAQVKLAIEGIDSGDQLDDLIERCWAVANWNELLQR